MITNLAWFAMMRVILFASHSSFSAEEQIVPAHDEPIQPIPIDTTLDPDKVELGAFLFNDPRLSKDNSLSCASCHILDAGGDVAAADPDAAALGAREGQQTDDRGQALQRSELVEKEEDPLPFLQPEFPGQQVGEPVAQP